VNGSIKLAAPLIAALAIAACSGGSSSLPGTSGLTTTQSMGTHFVPDWQAKNLAHRACSDAPRPGYAECDVLIDNNQIQGAIAGWQPIDFQTRYNLPSGTKGSGQIVAIVDAFHQANAASDLAAYRTQFGLGTGTFSQYNQKGQKSNYPPSCVGQSGGGWCVEIDLDIEMVAAVCPKCTIYLVEANSNNGTDLETAEKEAVKLKAHVVSNSWGCPGSNNCDNPNAFATKGVIYLASAGDGGYGTQAPAALGNVVAAGGTVLLKQGTVYKETAWNGTGSGCATGITKPSWQHDTGCTYRTMNEVSAVAQNAAEYIAQYGGWVTVSGTSVSSPLLGGVFGLAGNASKLTAGKKFWTLTKKQYAKSLHDITTGNNGHCSPSYLCVAGPGYDGPTGWGSPNGVGAF
jgi:subtilase family serine protease